MLFLKCPKNEQILEYVSIANELPGIVRFGLSLHIKVCVPCSTKATRLSEQWKSFFQPEVDMTSSLMRVYSRLQKDETLVIKGWKLNDSRLLGGKWRSLSIPTRTKHWALGGGVVSAVAATLALLIWTNVDRNPGLEINNASATLSAPQPAQSPFAQIRLQDKNRVQIHYVQPELLNTIEFETTNQR